MMTEGYEVEICNAKWFIKEEYPEIDNEEPDDGDTNFNKQVITINADLHTHRKSLAVVHELMHVVCDYIGLDEDEELIRKLEAGVLEIVQNIPDEYRR